MDPGNSEDPLFVDRQGDNGPKEGKEIRRWINKDTVFRRHQLLPPQAIIPHHKDSPPPHGLWPARSRPHLFGVTDQDFDSQIRNQKGFIEIERDRTREWWKAEWNSQLQWWFWVIDSGPAGVNEGQHLAALECHRQKADDGLGWRKD